MPEAKDKINLQFQHGQYKKSIGYHVGTKGLRVEKVWQLGPDKANAEALAMIAVATWARIKREGRNVWTPADIAMVTAAHAGTPIAANAAIVAMQDESRQETKVMYAEALAGFKEALANLQSVRADHGLPPTTEYVVPEIKKPFRLHAQLDAFVEAKEGEANGKKHKRRIGEFVKQVKNEKTKDGPMFPDCEMASVDFLWLQKFTNYWKGRPVTKKFGKPMAVNTVKNLLTIMRMAFDWIDLTANGRWVAPRRFDELFAVDADRLHTALEKRQMALGIEQMTTAEIKTLYAAGTDWHRTFLLLGIFCGMGQTELSHAGLEEFDLENARFIHLRHKRPVIGKYWLPPELVALLRPRIAHTTKHFADRNPNNLAFLTREGKPLVDDDANSDSIRQAWDDLLALVNKNGGTIRKGITFYSCRRKLGSWMKLHGGTELGQTALAQTQKTVLGKNYATGAESINFDAFFAAQKKLYAELKKAGVFDVATSDKKVAAA